MFIHTTDRLKKIVYYNLYDDVYIDGTLTVTGLGTIATPVSPTDDTTAIATTEWVNAAVTAGGGLPLQAAGDAYKFLMSNGTTADWFTLLVPNDTSINSLDHNSNTVGILKMNVADEIDFLAPVNIFALRALPDTYGNILNIDLTSDSDYSDKVGATIYVDGNKMVDIRVQADGAGGTIDGSEFVELKANWVTDENWTQAAITGDTQLGDVPEKYILVGLVLIETAGNTATLDLGTTAGASDIFAHQTIVASSETMITINRPFLLSGTSLYLNDDDASSSWNSASVDVFMRIKKWEE